MTIKPVEDSMSAVISHVLTDVGEHIVIGPLMLDMPEDEPGYGVVIGGGGKKFHYDIIRIVHVTNYETDKGDGEMMRERFIIEIATEAQKRIKPVPRIHVFDDELAMARWVWMTWPCNYTMRIVRAMELKYAERAKEMH